MMLSYDIRSVYRKINVSEIFTENLLYIVSENIYSHAEGKI